MDTRIITLFFVSIGASFNQPKFCPNASWNPDAITFANVSTVGQWPKGIFINKQNTIFVVDRDNSQMQIWFSGSGTPTSIRVANASKPYSFFVTNSNEIFIDNGLLNGLVDIWTMNGTLIGPAMMTTSACYGLFIDIVNNIYCSVMEDHQVISRSLDSSIHTLTIVAGTGCSGNSSRMLYWPRGIFVHTNLDLYVTDNGNHRIQLFHPGQLSGITLAGSGAPGTISLFRPTAVVLDGDGYLFIVDCYNSRIIGSGPNGFRIVAGGFGNGNASNQLLGPFSLSFDSEGNMFVVDGTNYRIQKFFLLTNSCSK